MYHNVAGATKIECDFAENPTRVGFSPKDPKTRKHKRIFLKTPVLIK
jgi:hypothetical protein